MSSTLTRVTYYYYYYYSYCLANSHPTLEVIRTTDWFPNGNPVLQSEHELCGFVPRKYFIRYAFLLIESVRWEQMVKLIHRRFVRTKYATMIIWKVIAETFGVHLIIAFHKPNGGVNTYTNIYRVCSCVCVCFFFYVKRLTARLYGGKGGVKNGSCGTSPRDTSALSASRPRLVELSCCGLIRLGNGNRVFPINSRCYHLVLSGWESFTGYKF